MDIARAEGRVVVEDLAQRFEVTLQTIRRDLAEPDDAGLIDQCMAGRSRAPALPISPMTIAGG